MCLIFIGDLPLLGDVREKKMERWRFFFFFQFFLFFVFFFLSLFFLSFFYPRGSQGRNARYFEKVLLRGLQSMGRPMADSFTLITFIEFFSFFVPSGFSFHVGLSFFIYLHFFTHFLILSCYGSLKMICKITRLKFFANVV